jgi:ribosome-binding protein aMBF1 (putative translation factor)
MLQSDDEKEFIMMTSKTKPMVQKYPLKQKVNSDPEILDEYCKHIKNWSTSWKISTEDLAIGQAITQQFNQFLISRIEKGRAKRTIKRYADYLWVLGGELIRHLNEDETERWAHSTLKCNFLGPLESKKHFSRRSII